MTIPGLGELCCVTMSGYPGVGKTMVAKKLHKQLGAILLRTDEIREAVIKQTRHDPDGILNREDLQMVYRVMFRVATSCLASGHSVVMDATFSKSENRSRVLRIAREAGAAFAIVNVTCPSELVQKRLVEGRKGDSSQADFSHHLAYKNGIFAPFSPEEKRWVVEIPNSGDPKDLDILLEDFATSLKGTAC